MKTSRKKNVSLAEHIQGLGDDSNYHQQTTDFLAETDTSYQARYKELGKHFPDDKDVRDVWEIKLERNGREYIFQYGDSLQNTWNRLSKFISGAEGERTARYLLNRWERDDSSYESASALRKQKKFEEELKEFTTGARFKTPSAYDVLSAVQGCEPSTTFEDFVAEFGYEIEGTKSYENALETFGKVVEEYTSLCTLYNNEEMEALSSIN